MGGSGYGNNIYGIFPAKATLEIKGDLSTMVENWTAEEWENRRRIVLFKKSQHGSQLQCSFRPVSVNERPPNSILVSCIYWAEKQEFFVTSVDTIHLLEQLVAAPPSRFTVEEKNRIRRNLEGLHPITVSKSKAESEEFFKVIMASVLPSPGTSRRTSRSSRGGYWIRHSRRSSPSTALLRLQANISRCRLLF